MRATTRRTAEGLALGGGVVVVLFRPGTRANHALRHQLDVLARRARHLAGRLHGLSYRVQGRRPDPDVSDAVLADRIRSSLGPLVKRLDLPHVHVMCDGHVAVLHGEVSTQLEAEEIEAAVVGVSGVLGLESHLHVGLGRGTTRPSTGRSVEQSSDAHRRLIDAATAAGVDPAAATAVVCGILGAFAERLPDVERAHAATHLPADVRAMFIPPRRVRGLAPARTVPELIARINTISEDLPPDKAPDVTRAVLRELRALIPDEAADVAAVLPADLQQMWEQR